MSDHQSTTAVESRVSRLEGEVEQVVGAVRDLTKAVGVLNDKIDAKTSPNISNQIALAAVILTIVGLIAAPCGWYITHEFHATDERLQREMRQINETTLERVNTLDRLSVMRHDEAILLTQRNLQRIERLEDWNRDQLQADLDELRLRRMNDR